MANKYAQLTKYLDVIADDNIGEWVIDEENDGTPEHPVQMGYVDYSNVILSFIEQVYRFIESNKEMELNRYEDILNENGIKWGAKLMTEADVSNLDARCIMALIVGAVRLERFYEGALLNFFKEGIISKWLKRLRDLEETEKEDNPPEQEWQWCLVGNIVGEHEYGENHELRYGTKQFRPNAKVYINLVYGGMGHEYILVIGTPRHSNRYIEIVIARKYVENFRLQKVFKPVVLKRMDQSDWDWWGNTDSARDRLIRVLEWLNPIEAEKAKRKFIT